MLELVIPSAEFFDEDAQEFRYTKEHKLRLEHSLLSLAKWESKWHKPFFSKDQKTPEETLDYIRFMTISPAPDPLVYSLITSDIVARINAYIDDPMTATTFREFPNQNKSRHQETITAEIIYYWMIALAIPFECQKWHLNRLLTLIRVTNIKSSPSKKMSKREIREQNAILNAQRRARLHTKG